MGNSGRRYNREKWGWKDESQIKHPYYDSDRKRRTEEFSLKAIGICFVAFVICLVITMITS